MRGRGGEFVRDTLLSPTCFTRGLFDRDAIERLMPRVCELAGFTSAVTDVFGVSR